ncbi:unnamed protein product [Closterium sp. NIES-54]
MLLLPCILPSNRSQPPPLPSLSYAPSRQPSTAQHSALHTRPAMELNQQERPAGSVDGGRPSLQEQQQEEPGQRGVRSLQEVEEEARRQLDPSVFLILLNCASPGVPEEQLVVHFSSRFNRRPHPNSALEKMMHTEWQRRKVHQPSLYNGSKFRYGGFSLHPPSSATSPSAAAAAAAAAAAGASEAPQGSEAAERGVQGSPRVCLHLGLTDYKSLITTNLCSDWRSFLAPSLSGSTFAKRLKTAEGTGRGGAGGADGVADEGESVEGACRDEGVGGGSRECGAGRDVTVMTQDGDEPGNAAPAATASAAATDSQECHHPKESGERMAACATCQQAIGQRDAQACQHMGDALGNASLVVTADGCFLLLQRGTAVGEFPNCPVFPGGHPEPSEAGISETPQSPPAQHHPTDPRSSTTPASPPLSPTDSPSSSPSLLNATIAHEMFEGMKREVEEETGAPADSLHGMLFLGLCRRRENVRSLAMFLCHTSLTAPEVLSRYASAQHKFESTSLRAVPLDSPVLCCAPPHHLDGGPTQSSLRFLLCPLPCPPVEHQINLQPRVSLPETTPTLRWTGKVGDASAFRVWGSRAFVHDTTADKLSSRAVPCVFLGFPPDAPGWQFYHPTSRRVLSSQDVTFDESVSYYHLFPHRTASPPPPPLFLAPNPPLVDPLPPQGPAPSGVSQVNPAKPVKLAVDSGAARGAEPGGAESRGAETGGAEPGRAEPGRAEPGGVAPEGTVSGGAEPARAASGGALGVPSRREPLSPQRLREWYSRCCRVAAGAGAGAAEGAGAAGGAAGATGGAGAGAAGGAAGTGDPGAEGTDSVSAVSGGAARPRPYFVPLLQQVLGSPPSPGPPPPPFLSPPPVQSQSQLQPASPLPGPSPYSGPTRGLTERREPEPHPVSPESRPASPVRTVHAGRVSRPRLPPVPGTHSMTLRPSTAPQRVPLPSPPASSLPDGPVPESDSLRAASPTVTRFLATAVTDPLFESSAASALVAELVDFAAACRLDYAASLVAESMSASVCPPSVGGECALGTDVLEDRQEDLECFAAASPHLVSILLAPEGDPDALDIPTPHSYAEAIEGPYSSQWQAAMDADMASWKSTGTYVDEARYVARGFSQRQGVDFFQTFSSTPKMTTLWVLLHVAAQRDYELDSLDFSTAFLQGSIHEEIWLRRPPGFTGSFPSGTQWSLRRPVYGLRQAPREWHDTFRTTLAALGFAPSTSHPSLFLRTDTTLPPFYFLVYVDDLVFATADTGALAHVKSQLQKRHMCRDLGELTSYLGLRITRDRAQRTITLTQSHMVQQVLQRFGFTYSSLQSTPLPTGHSLSAPPSDESVEPSGPAQRTITLTQSHMVQQVLQRFGFTYSSLQSTPLPTGHSLSAPPSDESVEPSGSYPELVGCLMYLMTCTRPDLAYPLSLLARYVAPGRHRKVHWDAAKRVLRYLCSTSGMGLVLGGRARFVLTGHADASWVDDLATQRSSQGYTFCLGSGSVSWQSTRSSSVLGSSCEVEIYAGAMAAQELRWLTYLLTDLGEPPRSPPVLYVDNKAMLALCREHRLEHRTKHIALRYFLARELQQRGQLRLAYVASEANTADIFTKALPPGDHQRFCTMLGQVWRRRDYERRGGSGRQLKLLAHGATGATGTRAIGATGTLATGASGTRATGVTGSAANSELQEQRTHGRLEQRAHGRLAQRAHGRLAQRSHGRLELRASRRPPPFNLPKLSHPPSTHPLLHP